MKSYETGVRAGLRWLVVLLACVGMMGAVPAVTDKDAQAALENTQAGFRLIHNKMAPAVVSISSQMEVADDGNPLNQLFGNQGGPRTASASGSGVLIRPEGIVLTNSHVVNNATKVTVQLNGSERKLPAEVVQSDPRTDLAIVRITEKGTYPTAPLGNAGDVEVGDWAIAFGSPFRLTSTMTVGVISATGRRLRGAVGDYDYRDILQTDASINPGNSGGPLVNVHGEVVGINFMIYSPGDSPGSVGIGFAIPINDYTKDIIDTLVQGKPYERGLMGVAIKDLDDVLREQTGVKEGGVYVDSVQPGGAAEKAGVKAEDVIVSYNGTKITTADQFVRLVERTRPGTAVPVVVVRGGKETPLTVTVAAAPTGARADAGGKQYGMAVVTITPELVDRYHLAVNSGVLVTQVVPGGAADDAGLEAGDVIVSVNKVNVASADAFWTALDHEMTGKRGVALRVRRGDQFTTLTLMHVAG